MRLRLVIHSCTWESNTPKYTTLGWRQGREREEREEERKDGAGVV